MWPFEYMSPGTPVNKPDCETFNTIFRILNEIQGENCWIEKTVDGSGWQIKLDLAAIGGAIGTLPTQSEGTENLFLMSDGESAAWKLLGPESLRSINSEGAVVAIDLSSVGPDPSGFNSARLGEPSGAGGHLPVIRHDIESGGQFYTAQNVMDLLGDSTRSGDMAVMEGVATQGAHTVSAIIRWQGNVSGTEFFKTGWVNLFNGDPFEFYDARGKICVLGFPQNEDTPLFEYKSVADVIGTGTAGRLAKFKADGTLEGSLLPERVALANTDATAYDNVEGLIPVFSDDGTYLFNPTTIDTILSGIPIPYADEEYDHGGPNEQSPAEPFMLTMESQESNETPGVYELKAQFRAMLHGQWTGNEDQELVMLRLTGAGTSASPYKTRLERSGYTIASLLSASLPDPGVTDNKVVFFDQDIANQGIGRGWKVETRNEAFNVAFGTTAGTVAEGNHTHTPAEIGASATSHNHNLADLSERSYLSLTDKPTIPGSPDNIDVLLKSIGSFDPTKSSTNYMPLYLRWTGTDFLWDDLCDSASCTNGGIAIWSNTNGTSAQLLSSTILASSLPYLSELTVNEIAAAGIPLLNGQKLESSFGFKISTDAASAGTSDTDLVTEGYVASLIASAGGLSGYNVLDSSDALSVLATDLPSAEYLGNYYVKLNKGYTFPVPSDKTARIAVFFAGTDTLAYSSYTTLDFAFATHNHDDRYFDKTYVENSLVKGSFSAGNNVVMVADSYGNTIKKSTVLVTDLVSNGSAGLGSASTYMVLQKKLDGTIGFDWLRAH